VGGLAPAQGCQQQQCQHSQSWAVLISCNAASGAGRVKPSGYSRSIEKAERSFCALCINWSAWW